MRPCRIAKPDIEMSRKARRVPVTLDSRDVKELPEDEIRMILHGAQRIVTGTNYGAN